MPSGCYTLRNEVYTYLNKQNLNWHIVPQWSPHFKIFSALTISIGSRPAQIFTLSWISPLGSTLKLLSRVTHECLLKESGEIYCSAITCTNDAVVMEFDALAMSTECPWTFGFSVIECVTLHSTNGEWAEKANVFEIWPP